MVEQICKIINSVSFSHNRGRRPETLEGRIVQDKEEMNTDAAKEMAQKRHEYMKDFLEEYYLETGYRYEG